MKQAPREETQRTAAVGPYTLIRSRRRTLGLEIRQDATLVVRAPLRFPAGEIATLLQKKAAWITGKQQQVQLEAGLVPHHEFLTGEHFPYLGHSWPLCVAAFQRQPLLLDPACGFLLDAAAVDRARAVFELWYRARAREVLQERVRLYAPHFPVAPLHLRITGARRRWGSCSTNGTVSFAWRLVMAPEEIIDYVVVHELAHLQEMNHSQRFWEVVAGVLPDYPRRRAWLQEHGRSLTL